MKRFRSDILKNLIPLILLVLSSALSIVICILSLRADFFIVFQNTFYIPIIISCFYYGRRGFAFSAGLVLVYVFMVLAFTKDPTIILQALIRVLIFMSVAAIISYLSLLREQTERFRVASDYTRSLVEASLDSLVVIGKDGNIMDMNATMESMTGYSRAELMGTDLSNYFTEPEQARIGYKDTLLSGYVSNIPLEIRHRDGRLIPVLYDASVFHDQSGQVAGVFAAARDITERKLMEEALKESRTFALATINALTAHIAVLDERGFIVSVNEAWRSFARSNPPIASNIFEGADYLGTCDSSAGKGSETARIFGEGIRSVIRGEKNDFSLDYDCHSPSEKRWFTGKVSRFTAKNSLRIVISHENITVRKEAEEALRSAHSELEKKVEERTRELSEANTRLKELDRLKSMFIASMSHELRTPLNSIIGFTGLILMGLSGTISEEQRTQLGMVKNSALHLLSLINDVIDVSKIEGDKIELSMERFNLPELLSEAVESLKPSASQKGLAIALAAPEELLMVSDRRRIRQLVVNLAGNAVKYTDQGKINVHAAQIDGKVEISVSDTGTGIKEEDMGKLFSAFSRIKIPGQPIVEGTGLGLYLSQRIAELLGGNITVESRFGEGSTFTLSIPIVYEDRG